MSIPAEERCKNGILSRHPPIGQFVCLVEVQTNPETEGRASEAWENLAYYHPPL